MTDIPFLIESLSNSPIVLKNLVESIPESRLKAQRIPGKWTIHENACHLAQAEPMLLDRFKAFQKTVTPQFKSFVPGKTVSSDDLILRDLGTEMKRFADLRAKTVALLNEFNPGLWSRSAIHEEYSDYNPYILLRHIAMHDYHHMYTIETLWLTQDNYLNS